ncbi:MAG TPA: FkbM family methyltransferase [Longimicrobiaceae bacterium]|nr:FkbM family methyltransferase [Longimicrobiaceae bacterium]
MIGHAAAAVRNAVASSGFRRFGLPFARDYLRFAWKAARRWGHTGPGVLPWMGRRIRYGNQTSALFLVHEIFAGGAYDFDAVRPDPVVVDCGANLGMSVLYFHMRYPRAHIVAVEPHPDAFRLLQENTAGLEGVELIRAAVTGAGEPTVLFAPEGEGASLVSSVDSGWMGQGSGIPVDGIRLSALLAGLGHVDFVKLDVEGAEYGIIRDCGAPGVLDGVREMAIEYHRTPSEPGGPDEIVAVLRDSGFQVTAVEGRSGKDGIIRARRTE